MQNLIDDPEQVSNEEQLKMRRKKLMIIIVGWVSFLTYICLKFYSSITVNCIHDYFHQLTASYNEQINSSEDFRFYTLLFAQLSIDFLTFVFIILNTFKIKNFMPFCWLILFYGTRTLLLNTIKLPFPPSMYWEDQGIFSLSVPYGKTRDFFYSGHTGFIVFTYKFWSSTKCKFMKYCSVLIGGYIVWVLIITRVHYCIDILGGCLFALFFYDFVMEKKQKFDRAVSSICFWIGYRLKILRERMELYG